MILKLKFPDVKKRVKMAVKYVIIAEACICLVLAVAFTVVKIRLSSAVDSVAQLTAEVERTRKAYADAVAEVEFLLGAMHRLDALVKEANAAMDKVEEAHDAREKKIEEAPAEWLSCPLPASVCDAFGSYTVSATVADPGSSDATVRAAEN